MESTGSCSQKVFAESSQREFADRIQSFKGISFAHDADGNVRQKYNNNNGENRQYWWSAEARLDSAQQDNWSKVRYDYDALGRPVRKWRGDPNGWVFDRLWVYDGDWNSPDLLDTELSCFLDS